MPLKRKHHEIPWKTMRLNGWKANHCVPLALARAVFGLEGTATPEEHAEAAMTVAGMLRSLHAGRRGAKGLDANGTHWGGPEHAADRVGLDYDLYRFDPAGDRWQNMRGGGARWAGRNRYPTVAAVARAVRPNQRLLIRCTNHVGYAESDDTTVHLWDLGARRRVDTVLVLHDDPDERYTLDLEAM